MGQTWVKSDFGTVCGQKEIPKNGGVKPFLGICLVAGEGLEPTVLHFRCGENAAVCSAALTVHWTVIHFRLTLRVMRRPMGINAAISGAFRPFRLGFSFRPAILYPLSPSQLFLLWVRIWVKRMAPGNSHITNTDTPNKEKIKNRISFPHFCIRAARADNPLSDTFHILRKYRSFLLRKVLPAPAAYRILHH